MITKMIWACILLSSTVFALDWATDFKSAVAQANKENKNIMVMVEGEHCRWCKKMKGRTLSDDVVEKRLASFIVVKVFREDAQAMSKLPPVDGVPTIFFMKSDKAVIQEVLGYLNVEDFISTIDDVEKKTK